MTQRDASRIGRLLSNPWVDKTFAVVSMVPIAYTVYLRIEHRMFDFVQASLLVQAIIVILTTLSRRTPVRVTQNPWYWLLAFVATYWVPFIAISESPGVAIVPRAFANFLACIGLFLAIYARLSLGRNIGTVPAQRELVTSGAYGFVRHPIYTAIFVTYIAVLLLHYSPFRLVMVGLGIFWFLVKSIVEERFLAADPSYAAYMRRVPQRWIPGVV